MQAAKQLVMISLLSDWQYRILGLQGAWHLAYYVSSDHNTPNTLPYRIIQFKNGWPQTTIASWCRWTVDSLAASGLTFDFVVRALGSKELKPSGTRPLDVLGQQIVLKTNGLYVPDILYKVRETPSLHTTRSLPERRAAMNGVYSVANKSYDLNGNRVLILDDVTTTNTTVAEILRALRAQWPSASYSFFALGRTQPDSSLNNSITLEYFS